MKSSFKKRNLLPWWIKFFCWIFMILGITSVIILGFYLIGIEPELSLYGLSSDTNSVIINIFIFLSFLLNAAVGYLLWFEKRIAIDIGIVSVIWGIMMCILSTYIDLYVLHSGFSFRVELILLILFLIKLLKIKSKWNTPQLSEE